MDVHSTAVQADHEHSSTGGTRTEHWTLLLSTKGCEQAGLEGAAGGAACLQNDDKEQQGRSTAQRSPMLPCE